jgi:thiol-disulfide isomerase/thioredoxin
MKNVLEILYNTYIRPYSHSVFVIFLLILFIVVGYLIYKRLYVSTFVSNKYQDIANSDRRTKTAEIMFFHADWCPHCKKAEPEWKTFSDKYNGKVVNGYTVKCTDINCTDTEKAEIQASIQQYGVEHYPTVKLAKEDYIVDFDSKVTADTLEKFIMAVTNS